MIARKLELQIISEYDNISSLSKYHLDFLAALEGVKFSFLTPSGWLDGSLNAPKQIEPFKTRK